MKNIDYKEYQSIKNSTCVISFGAPWCRDCVFAKPILEQLSNEFSNIAFYYVDVDENEGIRDELGIRHIPTILFLKDGVEVHSRVVEPRNADIIKEGITKL